MKGFTSIVAESVFRDPLLEGRMGDPSYDSRFTEEKLDMIGRLLGSVRLLDMVLSNDSQVEWCVNEFLRGNYNLKK